MGNEGHGGPNYAAHSRKIFFPMQRRYYRRLLNRDQQPLRIIAWNNTHAVMVPLADVERLEALIAQGYRLNGVGIRLPAQYGFLLA